MLIWLLLLLPALYFLYRAGWLSPSVWKKYWLTKKTLFQLEDRYNRLYKCRGELMYQYDWAIERGDPKEVIRNIARNINSLGKFLFIIMQIKS